MSQPLPQEPEGPMKGGFGAPIRKDAPKPATGCTKPVGPYGLVTGPDGKMKTTRDNLPRTPLEEAIDQWTKSYNIDVGQDFLP